MVVHEPVMGVENRKQSTVDNARHDTIAEVRSRFEFPERVGEPTRKTADRGELMPGMPSIAAIKPEHLPNDAFVLHVQGEGSL